MNVQLETRIVSFSQMNPAPYNPRKKLQPGDRDYENLKTSLERFGYVEPIVWNEVTGNIVGGHQKFQILVDEGENQAATVVVHLTHSEEKTLNVCLNQIHGQWDTDKLSSLLQDLEEAGLADLTGFSEKEIAKLINQGTQEVEQIGEIDLDTFAEEAFEHKCPRCGFRW